MAEVDEQEDHPFVFRETHFDALVTSDDKSTSQPPLFWKAVGYMLQKVVAIPASLIDERQALFIAPLDQLGVPVGASYPQGVTNYQLYAKADKVQVVDHPAYSLERLSYYETIYEFLRYTSESPDSLELDKYRDALSAAESKKNVEWHRAFSEYYERGERSQTLIDSITQDAGYIAAWKNEQEKQEEYRSHLPEKMRNVGDQMQITKSANDRAEERKRNNMPCISPANGAAEQPPSSADIYYRPLYEMENYYTQYKTWLNAAAQSPPKYSSPYPISLSSARTRDWATLGHPGLDQLLFIDVLWDLRALYDKIKITISFLGGKPAAFDVSRGLWDINTLLDRSDLSARAPSYLRKQFCKTSRLILTYGFRIEVVLPEGISSDETERLIDQLPPPLDFMSPGRYSFESGGENYPLLLGVIASLV